MIYLDLHESLELELALSQVVQVERAQLNPTRPDLWWIGYSGKQLGIELKQGPEILGSLDAVEEQLGREMQGVNYLGLGIRGLITPTHDGLCQTWTQRAKGWFKSRVFNQSYKGYRAWLWRLEEMGVAVLEVPDAYSLAVAVAAAYDSSQKAEAEHKTFARLIPERYWLTESDQRVRNLALTLMGIRPSWGGGEERSLAIAGTFPDLATLVGVLQSGADEQVAKIKLRHSNHTVGPAAVSRLKESLGID